MTSKALFATILLCLSIQVPANDGFMSTTGGALNYSHSEDVRLVKEDLRLTLGAHRAKIRVDFLFKNDGKSQTVTMGFPENWSQESDAGALTKFRTQVDGKPVAAVRKLVSREIDALKAVWTKEVAFAAGQTRRVRVEYEPKFSGSAFGFRSIEYILTTGATWKSKIAELNITVDASQASSEAEVHLNLLDTEWKKKAVWWHEKRPDVYSLTLRNQEPNYDLSIHAIPWFWRYTVNGSRVPSLSASWVTFPAPQRRGNEIIASIHTIGLILGGKTPEDSWDRFGAIDRRGGVWAEIVGPNTIQFGKRRIVLKQGILKLSGAGGEPSEAAYLSDFVRAIGGSYRYDPVKKRVIIAVPRLSLK